jgi:hypothetical protein
MLFEVKAQVKERFGQSALDTEQEGDQEPPKPSVSVQKRMNGLKLDMAQCSLEKQRSSQRLIMKELFQFTHASLHFFRWRRNEARITRTSSSDPVLRPSEFTGASGTTSSFGKEYPVNVPNQSQRKGVSTSQSFQPVIQCRDVL